MPLARQARTRLETHRQDQLSALLHLAVMLTGEPEAARDIVQDADRPC
jgi:hypothetical protein